MAYLDNRAEEGIASLQRRRDAWKAMQHFWSSVDPALIDKQMVRDYSKSRPVGPATLRVELGMLSTALGMAARERWIDRKPEIALPPAPERKVRHLNVREFRLFFDAVKAPHARLYVQIGIATLARPSAILQLQWSQIDFERNLIDLNPVGRNQTRKNRPVVPINQSLRAALDEAFAARQTDYVIEVGVCSVLSIRKAFEGASQRSGVKATPYTLRHTGAVWAVERGINMAALAQLLGHDDDRTTQKHYARFSQDYLRDVVDAIDIGIVTPFKVRNEPPTPVYKANKNG